MLLGHEESPLINLNVAITVKRLCSEYKEDSLSVRMYEAPGTKGRPDVDTWRDHCFFIIGSYTAK